MIYYQFSILISQFVHKYQKIGACDDDVYEKKDMIYRSKNSSPWRNFEH